MQDEPPTWDNDSEAGLESVSEPDADVRSDDGTADDGDSFALARAGAHLPDLGEMSLEEPDVPLGFTPGSGPSTPPTLRAAGPGPSGRIWTLGPADLQTPRTDGSEPSTPSSQPVLVERPSNEGIADLPTPTLVPAGARYVRENAVPLPPVGGGAGGRPSLKVRGGETEDGGREESWVKPEGGGELENEGTAL